MSVSEILSTLRTCALRGSMYVPDFLSGKIEVSHAVLPIVTRTGSEPHPFADFPYLFFISSASLFGNTKKRHPLIPGYTTTFDLNEYFLDMVRKFLAFVNTYTFFTTVSYSLIKRVSISGSESASGLGVPSS